MKGQLLEPQSPRASLKQPIVARRNPYEEAMCMKMLPNDVEGSNLDHKGMNTGNRTLTEEVPLATDELIAPVKAIFSVKDWPNLRFHLFTDEL